MTGSRALRLLVACSLLLGVVWLVPVRLDADHRWGPYHWARGANPVLLTLGDNVSSLWKGHLLSGAADWSASSVLEADVVDGLARSKNCRPETGRIEVCSASYGLNGWLGVAQIWVSGGHITQAATKVNDTYFVDHADAFGYNTPDWRQFVMCQEIGHTFGLDHQDENFENTNIGSCMDYTSDPAGSGPSTNNTAPNRHDFDQLEVIYAHLDGPGGGGGGGGGRGRGNGQSFARFVVPADAAEAQLMGDTPAYWGQLVRARGRFALFDLDLGFGNHIFTFVIWA